MGIDLEQALAVFRRLEEGNGNAFFESVADDVDWTVMGTHPLAGHYRSRAEFLEQTFGRLKQRLPEGAQLHVTHLMTSGDWAVVELESRAVAPDGFRFDNTYCWLARFVDGKIVQVRAYLDSALVQRLFDRHDDETPRAMRQ